MKKYIKAISILLVLISSQGFSQEKKLTFDDIMNWNLYPRGLSNLQWISDNEYTYNLDNDVVIANAETDASRNYLNLSDINNALKKSNLRELKNLPYNFVWNSKDELRFVLDSNWVSYNVNDKKINILSTIPKDAKNIDYSNVGNNIAYTIDNNLYVYSKGNSLSVTQYPDTGIVAGQAVHRSEFGITKGTFWSPSGNNLAFYLMDESMVTEYPLVDINTRIAEVNMVRYPMAGMTSHQVKLGIYNINSNKTIYIKTGEPLEQYLTNISWSPDEKYIFIVIVNRDQNHIWLNQYDAHTGDFVKTLFEESDSQYVEPQNPIYFLKTKPDQFIWQSRRDGYNHLYLYNLNGTLIKQLTYGDWEVTNFDGFNNDETVIFYTSTKESPLERHFYSTNIENNKTVKLTKEEGTHNILRSTNSTYFLDNFNNIKIANKISLINNKGKNIRTLKLEENPFKDYEVPSVELITLQTNDSFDLYGRIIKPPLFDKNKKYPVLVYVYGGPHSQLVTNSWMAGANLFFYYLASEGYIIWTLDNRGTSYRGADFEQVIHRNLGDAEVEDQMIGVDYLKSLPYVDESRIGVDGWSYGGFMTLSLMSRNPGVFKVATAGGPVIDWKYYEIMYGERYMDKPQDNKEGYEKSSLLNYVDKLNGKVLIIHGAQDATVVWQNSLQYIDKCIKQGKQVDYFVYPNHEHNVRGYDRLHLYKKLADYYFENL